MTFEYQVFQSPSHPITFAYLIRTPHKTGPALWKTIRCGIFAICNLQFPSEANGNFSSFASRNIALIYGYDCLRWTSFFSPDFTEDLEQNYLHYQNLTNLSLFLFSFDWYFKKKRFRILPCFQGFALHRSKSVLTRRIENVNESVYWFLSPKSRFDFADRWS